MERIRMLPSSLMRRPTPSHACPATTPANGTTGRAARRPGRTPTGANTIKPNPEEGRMNHNICVMGRPRRVWPPTARTAAAVVAMVALVLLAAACGPSGSSNAGGSRLSQLLAFSHCMRSNGVLNFPDPDSSGAVPKETAQQLGVSSSQFQSAYSACQHLLPNGGNGPDQTAAQQARAQALRYSQCMRDHGVTLPDPDSSGRIPDPASVGIDQGAAQFQAANQACDQYRPPYIPSNSAFDSWRQTHPS
jgi:hypothetical protein